MCIEKRYMFDNRVKFEDRIDGFEVSYNVLQLTNGTISLYALEVMLTDESDENAIIPNYYNIPDELSRRDVEGLSMEQLKLHTHELATKLVTDWLPEIKKHREAKKAFLDIDNHLRKDLRIGCGPRAFF